MARYLVKRLLHSLGVLVVVILGVFLIFYMLGDPTNQILGPGATDAQREAFRHARGFDRPLLEQLGTYLGHVGRLSFGDSYALGQPAMHVVLTTLPRTLILAATAFVFAAVVGVLLGLLAAFREGRLIDRIVVTAATFFSSVTEFWIGLLLIVVVSVQWGLLPTAGYGIGAQMVLPALTLAVAPIGRLAFVTRANAVVAMSGPHVTPSIGRGLANPAVVRRHVLRNASAPTVAIMGLELTRMVVGGSVIVESVFAWPGIGRLFLQAMKTFDLPVVSAAMFVGAVFVLVLNLLIDLAYVVIDPRVRYY